MNRTRLLGVALIVVGLLNLAGDTVSQQWRDAWSWRVELNAGSLTATPVPLVTPTPARPVATLTPMPPATQALDCEIEVRRSSGIEWATGVPDSYCTAEPGSQLTVYVPQR